MIKRRSRILLIVAALPLFLSGSNAQSSGSGIEVWPKLTATIELWPNSRIQVWGEKQNGEDFDFNQWKVGAILSYRMKRILNSHEADIDEENEHNLSLGGGYEYLQTNQDGTTKRENRIILQAIPRYRFPARVLLQDRNRVEFRWANGDFSARYRNRLTVQRPFKTGAFRFTPYASGELFYDGKHHAWTQNQYAFGVQLPYKKRLMFDTYYLRQNCTTCSENPLSVFGVTLNLYFRRK